MRTSQTIVLASLLASSAAFAVEPEQHPEISTQSVEVVTIYGVPFPSSRYWMGSEPNNRDTAPVYYAALHKSRLWQAHLIEVFTLVAVREDGGASSCCWRFPGNPNKDGDYAWQERVVFFDGKYVTRGFDLTISRGKDRWLINAEIDNWIAVYDDKAELKRHYRDREIRGRSQARFLDDGESIFWHAGSNHTQWGKLLMPRGTGEWVWYELGEFPLPVVNQGEFGELIVDKVHYTENGWPAIIQTHGANRQHNVSIPDTYLDDSDLLYHAYYDRDSDTVYFGHTAATHAGYQVLEHDWRFSYGLKPETIERYDFAAKKHEILYPEFKVKSAWTIDFASGGLTWWSPEELTRRRVKWVEYENGKPTGAKKIVWHRYHPLVKDDVGAVMPKHINHKVVGFEPLK